MHKLVLPKKEWVAQAATAGGYYVRVLPVETTDEEGNVLVTSVEDKIDHKPTKKDFSELEAKWLEASKRWKVREVEDYAKSPEVKAFAVNGSKDWRESEERLSIRRSAADKAAQGRESYNYTHGGTNYVTTPAKVEEMLAAVEVYASDCHDVTEAHKAAIQALTSAAEVEAYEYATNYPQPLAFEL